MPYLPTKEEERRLRNLERFIAAVRRWASASSASDRVDPRSIINGLVEDVRETVVMARCCRLLTVTPPPITGGLVMNNIDAFANLFTPPYGVDMVSPVLDMSERAAAVIRAGKYQQLSESAVADIIKTRGNQGSKTRVFVVHGHDEHAREATARFLAKLGLEPIILNEQASRGKTLIEKIEHYSDVAFAVVLLTPDDLGAENISGAEKRLRARQNVILELGYFMGLLGRNNVAALVKGNVEKPSDYDGVTYVTMDSQRGWQTEMARELSAAGLTVDLNKLI
jgi:predicted nucleotide-binding protein